MLIVIISFLSENFKCFREDNMILTTTNLTRHCSSNAALFQIFSYTIDILHSPTNALQSCLWGFFRGQALVFSYLLLTTAKQWDIIYLTSVS